MDGGLNHTEKRFDMFNAAERDFWRKSKRRQKKKIDIPRLEKMWKRKKLLGMKLEQEN